MVITIWAEHGGKTKNYRAVMNSTARGNRSCLWQPDFSSVYQNFSSLIFGHFKDISPVIY